MSNNDPLYFLKEATQNVTSNIHSFHPVNINPVHFILNIFLIVVLIYITMLAIKFFMKGSTNHFSYLLKEININQSLKIYYIKINKKLYIMANNNNNLLLMDTIKDSKEIVQILTENEEEDNSNSLPFPLDLLKKKKSSLQPDLPSNFESTLKSIIQDSEDLEELNKK